jgi:glycosyl hydrolase family 26
MSKARLSILISALLLVFVSLATANTPPGQALPTSTAPPTISGTPLLGKTLTATTGSWIGAKSYSYRWLRCNTSGSSCVAIAGASASGYVLGSADVGYTLRVAVTASNKNGSSVATSAATSVVTAPASTPVNSALPVVSGSAVAGQTLSVSTGSWSGSPTSYAYQWRRCDSSGGACSNLSGATSASYALASADVGFTMRAAVTAKNSAGSATAVSGQTALVAAAPTSTSTSTSSLPASFFSGPAGTSNVVPASGALLGLWTDGTYTTLPTSLASRETQLGRKLDIYHFHYGAAKGSCYATAPFSKGLESWAWGRGVYSLVSWSPGYTIAQVNSGSYDSCFRDVAQRFKNFGHPAWLRLWWEFNGTWFPWSYDPNNAGPFITAWRRVVGIFKSVGATNTMFVWAPAEGYYDPTKRQTGYPGDTYVDWVASDGYNWNKSGAWCGLHAGWCEFWETFHHGYSGSQARGVEVDFRNRKPYMVPEVASVEDLYTAGRKGKWMVNVRDRIKTEFPGLKAIVYSDFDRTASEGVNWRIDTTSSSLSGFKTLAQDAYFHTR